MKLDENILSGLKRSDAIYRTISLERLFELFATKQNVVVRPKLWDDPFENFALQSPMMIDGKRSDNTFKNNVAHSINGKGGGHGALIFPNPDKNHGGCFEAS